MFSYSIPLDRLPDVLSLLGHKNTIGTMVMPNTARERMHKLFNVPSSITANAKQVDEIAIANNTPIILSALVVILTISHLLFLNSGFTGSISSYFPVNGIISQIPRPSVRGKFVADKVKRADGTSASAKAARTNAPMGR